MNIENVLQRSMFAFTKGSGAKTDAFAQMLQLSSSSLYRAVNPDDAGAHLKVNALLPFMRITGDIAPLRYLAKEMGCVVFPLPKRLKKVSVRTVQDVQQQFLNCTEKLMGCSDGSGDRESARDEIYKTIEMLTALQKSLGAQLEIELEAGQCKLPL